MIDSDSKIYETKRTFCGLVIHYQNFSFINSSIYSRPWPPNLISHLFQPGLVLILVNWLLLFIPMVFYLRFHLFFRNIAFAKYDHYFTIPSILLWVENTSKWCTFKKMVSGKSFKATVYFCKENCEEIWAIFRNVASYDFASKIDWNDIGRQQLSKCWYNRSKFNQRYLVSYNSYAQL